MANRFEAEWITKQHIDEYGDWQPDDDEYACSRHKTFEAAKAAALAGARASGVEWYRVYEQAHICDDDDTVPYWQNVRHWVGDFEGCEEGL